MHGSPGNGKTSVIRAMLSRPGMTAHTLNFLASNVEDIDLQSLFERAAEKAPAMIVMEDIDRAFPRNQATGVRSNISLQQLLNCLDGIGTQDGIVVVATANEPTALDPAILRRPGRFDRVVLFSNPTAELRLQYLRLLNCTFDEAELQDTLDLSEGFSFAQMREVYILAGQRASDRKGELAPNNLLSAVQSLRYGAAEVKSRANAAGFTPEKTQVRIRGIPAKL